MEAHPGMTETWVDADTPSRPPEKKQRRGWWISLCRLDIPDRSSSPGSIVVPVAELFSEVDGWLLAQK
jgi:hypothetical protein